MAQLLGALFHLKTGGIFPPSHKAFASPMYFSPPLSPGGTLPSVYTGYSASAETVIQTSPVIDETLSERAFPQPQAFGTPTQVICADNGLPMGISAVPDQYGSLGGSQQNGSPFGFTQTFSRAGTDRGLEMANKANQFLNSQGSMNPLNPDLRGMYNRSFRIPEGYGWAATRQQTASSASEASMNPQTINPELVQTEKQQSADEVPVSPLRGVSRGVSDSDSDYSGQAPAARRRRKSEGDIALLDVSDGALDSSSSGSGLECAPGSRKRRRKSTLSSGSDLKRYARQAKEREMEKHREMPDFELGLTRGNKRERRRMQNRLAQRAFRARSKIHHLDRTVSLGHAVMDATMALARAS